MGFEREIGLSFGEKRTPVYDQELIGGVTLIESCRLELLDFADSGFSLLFFYADTKQLPGLLYS